MDSKNLYLSTSPGRLFVKTALPGGISMLASSLYTIFESMFIGKFLGTTAFAAFGLALPIVIVNFALADLIGVGASVPISIFLGRREDDKANNYFTCATLMIWLTGLIIGVSFYLGAPFVMSAMGAEGELLKDAVTYIRIHTLFLPFITMVFALDNFLRISGKVKTSMLLNIFMSLCTVVLEYLFICVFRLGIAGAAMGTSISMLLSAAYGIFAFARGKLQLKFTKPHFSIRLIVQIFKNGISVFLTNVAGRVFSVVMNVMLLKFGSEAAVAVYGVALTVGGIIEMLLYGVIDSLQPAIGYNYGAERIDRVKAIEKYVLSVGATISVLGGVCIFAFAKPLSIPFLEDAALLPLAVEVLRFTSFAYLVKWLSQAVQGLFMALEKPLAALIISVCSASMFPLILIFVFYRLGLTGLWLNYPCAAFLTTVLAIVLFVTNKKRLFTHKA